MKTRFIFMVVMALMVCLTGCKPKEERLIDKLNSLSERVEADSANFDAADWAKAMQELEYIHEKMLDCEFTNEQLREIGRADGRLSAIITKESARVLNQEVTNAIDAFGEFASGLQEGYEEATN